MNEESISSLKKTSKHKPLPEIINGFKVIKDLGFLKDSAGRQCYRFAIFECKLCKSNFTTRVTYIKRRIGCGCMENNITPLPFEINGIKIIKDLGVVVSANAKKGYRRCIFLCPICGNHSEVNVSDLKRTKRKTKCHCIYPELTIEQQNRLKKIHKGMLQRCENNKNPAYINYGGKGIKVCNEWKSIHAFIKWAIVNGYKNYLTIDRIDNNKGYNPSNCRWADKLTQTHNSKVSKFSYDQVKIIRADYPALTYSQISRKYNISQSTAKRIITKQSYSNVI